MVLFIYKQQTIGGTYIKKLFTILTMSILILGSCVNVDAKPMKNYYSEAMIVKQVKKVSKHNYKVTFLAQNGHMFCISTEDGDYNKNELYSFIMDSNGTKKVTDDRIVSHRYSGYISKKEAKKWVK